MGLLVCISLIRAVNSAGPLSLYDVLLQVEDFNFNIIEVQQLLEDFAQSETSISEITTGWDDSLTGIDGFATNIKNVIVLGFLRVAEFFALTILSIFRAIKNIVLLIIDILKIIFYVCGFIS